MNNETLQTVELVLNKLGITLSEGINAFTKWAWAEIVNCFILGFLIILGLIFLIKILPKILPDLEEVDKFIICLIFGCILAALVISFLFQLEGFIKAIISPKAYAIKQILECIR